MYIESPMEKYNKNNPFIIVAKKTYYSIIDGIHDFTKMCVKFIIPSIILSVIFIVFNLYAIFINIDTIFGNAMMVFLILNNFIFWYTFRKKINYFISKNAAIQEFSRLSELEVNAIIALNNEDLLKCTYGLYELRGELTATAKYYRIILEHYIFWEIVLISIVSILTLAT